MVTMKSHRVKQLPHRTFSHLMVSWVSICIILVNASKIAAPQDVAAVSLEGNTGGLMHPTALAIHFAVKNPNASRWSPRLSLSPRSAKFMLLMIAGDINPNPGPIQPRKRTRRRRPSLPDCPHCLKKVGYTKPAIRCDTCDKWWHASCGGLSDDQYDAL